MKILHAISFENGHRLAYEMRQTAAAAVSECDRPHPYVQLAIDPSIRPLHSNACPLVWLWIYRYPWPQALCALICIDFSLQILQFEGQSIETTNKRIKKRVWQKRSVSGWKPERSNFFSPPSQRMLMTIWWRLTASIFKLRNSPQKLARPMARGLSQS